MFICISIKKKQLGNSSKDIDKVVLIIKKKSIILRKGGFSDKNIHFLLIKPVQKGGGVVPLLCTGLL